jgi:hypothetical protein
VPQERLLALSQEQPLPGTSCLPLLSLSLLPRGQWPANPEDELPYFLREEQLAHLLDCTVRTLQRRRRSGRSPPYTKNGKQILYPRDPAIAYYMAAAA